MWTKQWVSKEPTGQEMGNRNKEGSAQLPEQVRCIMEGGRQWGQAGDWRGACPAHLLGQAERIMPWQGTAGGSESVPWPSLSTSHLQYYRCIRVFGLKDQGVTLCP